MVKKVTGLTLILAMTLVIGGKMSEAEGETSWAWNIPAVPAELPEARFFTYPRNSGLLPDKSSCQWIGDTCPAGAAQAYEECYVSATLRYECWPEGWASSEYIGMDEEARKAYRENDLTKSGEGSWDQRKYPDGPPPGSPCEWVKFRTREGDEKYCPAKVDRRRYSDCNPTLRQVEDCYPHQPYGWKAVLANVIGMFLRPSRNTNDSAVDISWYSQHETDVFKRMFASKIASSDQKTNLLYRWALPTIKAAFGTLSPESQQERLRVLADMKAYAAQYNHRAEEEHLARVEQADSGRYAFAITRPDGTERKNGVYEPFIFRRVADGIPIRQIRRVLDRLDRDLRPLVKPVPAPERAETTTLP